MGIQLELFLVRIHLGLCLCGSLSLSVLFMSLLSLFGGYISLLSDTHLLFRTACQPSSECFACFVILDDSVELKNLENLDIV